MVYLGLVDDDYDDYEAYEDQQSVAPQRTPRSFGGDNGDGMVSGGMASGGMVSGGGVSGGMVSGGGASGGVSTGGVRTLPREPEQMSGVSIQPRAAVVRPMPQPQTAKVHVVVPNGFNDAQEIGDRLKAGQPVIVNLQNCDRELSRRMMDFCSGAAYVLGAHPEKVADRVLLVTPTNVEVSPDEKRRLQERGLYRS
jgi:cell division inhibitor SepF